MSLIEFKKYLHNYFSKNRKHPDFTTIEKETGLNRMSIKTYLRQLEKIGVITRNYSQYKVNEKPVINKIFILKIIILIIGILATFIDIYYNYSWYQQMVGGFKSIIISICLVIFGVISFEMIIIFYQKNSKFLMILFSILFIMILSINISAIAAGQFNQYLQVKLKLSENNKNFYLMESLKKSENELMNSMSKDGILLNQYIQSGIDNWKLWKLKKDIETNQKKLEVIREKIGRIQTIKQEDFFNYIGKLIKVNPDIIQFIMQITPALLLELISCISIALSLFLKENNK